MISFLPALPTIGILAFETAGLHDFGKQYQLQVKFIHYLKLIVGAPLYQMVLMAAAVRAVWREKTGQRDWELTRHVGAHLTLADPNPLPGAEKGVA